MNKTAEQSSATKAVLPKRKIRWIVLGAMMVAFAIFVLMIVQPYLLEKRIAGKLAAVGASIYFIDGCPQWIPKNFHENLTVFNRVTKVAFGTNRANHRADSDVGPQVTDEQLKYLKRLKSLEELWLRGANVTSNSLAHLSQIPSLINLAIDGEQIDDTGLQFLKTMTNLKRLSLDGTQTTPEGRTKLRKSLPNCQITPDP